MENKSSLIKPCKKTFDPINARSCKLRSLSINITTILHSRSDPTLVKILHGERREINARSILTQHM